MPNYVSFSIAFLPVIVSVLVLTHPIGLINAINASSLITDDDIKKSLIAVQNGTEPVAQKLTDDEIKMLWLIFPVGA